MLNFLRRLFVPRPMIEERVPLNGTVEATIDGWLWYHRELCRGDVEAEQQGDEVVLRVWTLDPMAPE